MEYDILDILYSGVQAQISLGGSQIVFEYLDFFDVGLLIDSYLGNIIMKESHLERLAIDKDPCFSLVATVMTGTGISISHAYT